MLGQSSVPGTQDPQAQAPEPDPELDPVMPDETPIAPTAPGDAGMPDPMQDVPTDGGPQPPQPPGDAGVDAQPGTSAPMGPQPPTPAPSDVP